MNINELIRTLKIMGNPIITFSIYWTNGVLRVRFYINAGESEYDLLTARGYLRQYKTLKAVLSDLKNIDPGLNQDSKINFYFVE